MFLVFREIVEIRSGRYFIISRDFFFDETCYGREKLNAV